MSIEFDPQDGRSDGYDVRPPTTRDWAALARLEKAQLRIWPPPVDIEQEIRKGLGLMNTADDEVARRIQQAKIDREVADKMRLIEGFGMDDFLDGTVFKFSKKFVEDGIAYSYAAIKAGGKWYTTGPKSPKGYDWDEFILWLVSGIPSSRLILMEPTPQDLGNED